MNKFKKKSETMHQKKFIILKLLLWFLVLELSLIEIPIVLAQNNDSAKTMRLKPKKDNKSYFLFSSSMGISTTDTMLKADFITFQTNIGYAAASFFLPICINLTYNHGISKSQNTRQIDVHLTTFLPWGGGNIFLLHTLGPGISFGTKRDEKSNSGLKSFISPSFLCEGEISVGLGDKFTIGIKGSFSFNKERTIKGGLLTFRIFSPL